ncbi:MAG: 16S rRNA (guanine(966)-N(2))-methyltransferase RsmD [Solirubrobacteraceae bacterium]|jgi:16S rRNA (guanine966-N2)-methyltransferase
MRVVAGELGGRRFAAPRGAATRPTSERIREAVFSILGDIDGAEVLDLFAGSGALGIEALSRGAARVTFVESAPAALRTIDRNLAALALALRSRVVRADVRLALRSAAVRASEYDLVFLDPPYARVSAFAGTLADALPGLLAPAARVISECDRREPLELGLPVILERRYADTLISIYQARQ